MAVGRGPDSGPPTPRGRIAGRRSGVVGRGSVRGQRSTVGALSVSQIYRGHIRQQLLQDLAMGEDTHTVIARKLGVPVGDIKQFAIDLEIEIAEVRAALDNRVASEAAGLWIAKKQMRLAEIQSDIEDINETLDLMRGVTIPGQDFGSKRHQNLLRLKLAGLRAVADEMTPTRGPGRPPHNMQGVDSEDLNVVHYVLEAPEVMEAIT